MSAFIWLYTVLRDYNKFCHKPPTRQIYTEKWKSLWFGAYQKQIILEFEWNIYCLGVLVVAVVWCLSVYFIYKGKKKKTYLVLKQSLSPSLPSQDSTCKHLVVTKYWSIPPYPCRCTTSFGLKSRSPWATWRSIWTAHRILNLTWLLTAGISITPFPSVLFTCTYKTSYRSVWNLGNALAEEEAKPDSTQVPTHFLIYWTQVRPPILSSIHSKPSLSPARRLQTHVSSADRKSSAWGPAKAQVCSQGRRRAKSQWPTLPNGLFPKACSLQKYNQWPNSAVLGQLWL